MGFPRHDYWSSLPSPSLGDLSNPGRNSCLLHCSRFFMNWATREASRELQEYLPKLLVLRRCHSGSCLFRNIDTEVFLCFLTLAVITSAALYLIRTLQLLLLWHLSWCSLMGQMAQCSCHLAFFSCDFSCIHCRLVLGDFPATATGCGALSFLHFSLVSCFWRLWLWQTLEVPLGSLWLWLCSTVVHLYFTEPDILCRMALGLPWLPWSSSQPMALRWWHMKTQLPSLRSELLWGKIYNPDSSWGRKPISTCFSCLSWEWLRYYGKLSIRNRRTAIE